MKKVDVQTEQVYLWQGDNSVIAKREFVDGFGERFIIEGGGLDPTKPITRVSKVFYSTVSAEEIEKMNRNAK